MEAGANGRADDRDWWNGAQDGWDDHGWREGWHDWNPDQLVSSMPGCLSDPQLRGFYATDAHNTLATDNGRWVGSRDWKRERGSEDDGSAMWPEPKESVKDHRSTDRLMVP